MRARLRKRQVREALCSCGHAETLHMRLYGKCLAPLGNGSDVERRLSDLCCEVDGGCGRFSGVAPGLSPAEQATVEMSAPEFTPLSPPPRLPGRTGPPPTRPADREIPFEIDENGCFVLTRHLKSDGYGVLKLYGKLTTAHRAIWLDTVGQVPDDMQLDHLCRNPACINVDHLEAVTPRENILRSRGPSAQNARKTHCKRGHEYTQENTGLGSNGERICRVCKPARVAQVDAPHGTRGRYRSGCRCGECRTDESRRQYDRRYRHREPLRQVPSLAHPNSTTGGVA